MYTFEIFKERAWKQQHPLHVEHEDKPDWRYIDYLNRISASHVEQSAHGFPPRMDGTSRDQDIDNVPVFQLLSLSQNGDAIRGSFRHGRPSGHSIALPKKSLGPDAKPIDISDYSPTREYRFAFQFPDPGNTGLLSVEAVSGACPSRYLVQWARWWSQSYAEGRDEPWYNLKAFALGDAIQVQQFIERGQVIEVVLIAGAKKASRMRRTEEFRITSTLDVQGKSKALRDLKKVVAANKTDEDLAEELAKVLGRNVEEIDLDDGYVVLDTEYGRHHVSPSRIPDVFTYPIASERPDDDEFYREVKQRARKMSTEVDGSFNFS
ncbi:hypothetical protein [Mycolicibacterium peregrinum]|nr:hypothetical protein [Mycolicibacterium peregrinum]